MFENCVIRVNNWIKNILFKRHETEQQTKKITTFTSSIHSISSMCQQTELANWKLPILWSATQTCCPDSLLPATRSPLFARHRQLRLSSGYPPIKPPDWHQTKQQHQIFKSHVWCLLSFCTVPLFFFCNCSFTLFFVKTMSGVIPFAGIILCCSTFTLNECRLVLFRVHMTLVPREDPPPGGRFSLPFDVTGVLLHAQGRLV